MRSGKRRRGQRAYQLGLSASGRGRRFRFRLCGRRGRGQLRQRRVTTQPTASASAGSPPHRTTSPWAAPISATRIPARTALIGIRPTHPPTARRCPTFRKFRGTTPAPVCWSRTTVVVANSPTGRTAFATTRLVLGNSPELRSPAVAAPAVRDRARQPYRVWSAEPARMAQAIVAIGFWQSRTMACATLRMFRCSPPTASVGHYYVFCWSDTANGGAACTGAPSSWSGAGGTSFASPIMAGIQALVNQKTGKRQGQSQSRVLPACRGRVWLCGQQFLQLS